ncbi:MAG: hypothetical protein PWP71_647 [Clostridia bacterium]|nr:hypothetical protein [Clostridia bacterium]
MLKRSFSKKGVYSELAKELIFLAELDGAQATCLNIIGNLPFDIQHKIIIDLARANNPKLIPFFQLVAKEMEGEIKKAACRVLKKYEYLGYEIKPLDTEQLPMKNLLAFASQSRLEGTCVLLFLIEGKNEFQAHYFVLAFNHLGIKEYFQHRSVSKSEILNGIEKHNLVTLNFFEAQQLLLDAYQQNRKFGTKVANGFSQYQHLLNKNFDSTSKCYYDCLTKLSRNKLSPWRLINAYLLALKNMDATLIYDISAPVLQMKFGKRNEFLKNWVHPFDKYTFIKSIPKKWQKNGNKITSQMQLVACNENDELKKIDLDFELLKIEDNWFISNVIVSGFSTLDNTDPLNPLNYKVYTNIYKINSLSTLRNFFDNWELVHLTGELEGGVCYKWFKTSDPIEEGIDISKEVYGEFILTNHELIIFGGSLKNVTEIGYYLVKNIKDIKGINLELTMRNLCTVREVYQVVENSQLLLSESLKKNYIYYIPPSGYQKWYKYCKDYHNEVYVLDKNIRAFQIRNDNKILEVIFHKDHAFICSFNTSLEDVKKYLDIPQTEILTITNMLDVTYGVNKWNYLKLINNLKQEPVTSVYVPGCSKKEIARRLGLIV